MTRLARDRHIEALVKIIEERAHDGLIEGETRRQLHEQHSELVPQPANFL